MTPTSYFDMPNRVYHSSPETADHISRSWARQVYVHGAAGQRLLQEGVTLFSGSAATDLGSAFDHAVDRFLRSETPLDESCVEPPAEVLTSNGHRRGKAYEEWRSTLDTSSHVEVSSEMMRKLSLMFRSFRDSKPAMEIAGRTKGTQRSMFYEDSEGHKLKARLDGELDDGTPWDLKTTSASFRDLPKKCLDLGYIWQAAWYVDACKIVGMLDREVDMPFCFVQSVPPYRTRIYTFPQPLVEAARRQIRETLSDIRHRRETQDFTDAEDECVHEMHFSDWLAMQGGA